jgi:hypothetical protein
MKTLLWVLLASIIANTATALGGPIPTGPIYTNKLRFRIPFHYDGDELRRLGAKEIRLFVSRDRGQTWQQVQSVAPEAGKFNFQAPVDGEYWFIVRTLDARNRLHPDATNTEPGLQVVVDTAAPRLQLELRQTVPGKVQLTWNAADEHLDPTQLRLEYVQPGTIEWTPVGVIPKAAGQTEWAIPQGGVVAVRGSIADLARNTVQDEVQRRVAAGNEAVPRPQKPDLRQPIAGPVNGSRDNLALTLPDRFPGTSRPLPRQEPELSQADREPSPFRTAPMAVDGKSPRGSLVSRKADDWSDDAPASHGQNRDPSALAASRARAINNLQFQLAYKLHDIDAAGVDGVELYITPDGGAQWYHYGADSDGKSPVAVKVPRPGVYGFALGVRTKEGEETDVPRNGDPPAMEVVVDLAPPRVELRAPEVGRGRNANKLLIRWDYSDENPADLPISIFHAPSPRGPWVPIGDSMANTGRLVWNLERNLPVQLYLRIEARDQAGNVQTVETPEPVLLDLNRPTARILDVDPESTSGKPQ